MNVKVVFEGGPADGKTKTWASRPGTRIIVPIMEGGYPFGEFGYVSSGRTTKDGAEIWVAEPTRKKL